MQQHLNLYSSTEYTPRQPLRGQALNTNIIIFLRICSLFVHWAKAKGSSGAEESGGGYAYDDDGYAYDDDDDGY